MAIQKHNTYYDPKKPNEGITYYDENGNHKEVLTRNDLNAISSISSINDKVTALSAKTVTQIKSTETVTATPHTATDGTIYYELEAAPEVSDTVIYGENGISAKNQGTNWTIGLSSDFLSANALNNLSGNWQNTYNSVLNNSAKWNEVSSKINNEDFNPVKNDVETLKENSAHSTLSSKNDYIKVTNNGVNYGIEFVSGDLATKTWVADNYQNKGDYLSANALNNLSGKWVDTYNSVNSHSAEWNEVTKKLYTSSFESISGEWAFSADVDTRIKETKDWAKDTFLSANEFDIIKETSGNWDSAYSAITASAEKWNKTFNDVSESAKYWNSAYDSLVSADKWNETYERVKTSADEWDKITYKLDKVIFDDYVSKADSAYYTAGNGIEINNHVISISADYLSANALNDLSGRWENTSKVVENTSAKWNDTYSAVTANSANWNEVNAKLYTSSFTAYSANLDETIKTFSGEFTAVSSDFTIHSANSAIHVQEGERDKWTSAANRVENSAAIWDSVSAKVNITDFEQYKTSAQQELNKKLDKDVFDTWSAKTNDWDKIAYSGRNGIKVQNHWIEVSAEYALSADVDTRLENYYTTAQIDEKFADFGGFVTANSASTEPVGHPDGITTPDPKKIYLVEKDGTPDKFREWIVTGTNTTGWQCIGDTSMDLTPYLTKEEAAHTYQLSGYYVTSSTQDITGNKGYVLANDGQNVVWSGIDLSNIGKTYNVETSTPNYLDVTTATNNGSTTFSLSAKDYPVVEVSSTNGSIGIEKTITDNKVLYDLSVESAPEIYGEYLIAKLDEHEGYKISGAIINGENGVSAQYDGQTNTWNVGLEDKTYNYFGAQINSTTTTSTEETLEGYTNQTVVGDKIIFKNDTITLTKGLYHVDIQVEVTTPITNNYYNVELYPNLSNAKLLSQFDASYSHTDTLDLSFDVNLETSNGVLTFTLKGLPVGSTYFVRNLQIFEVLTIDAVVEGVGGQYTGGDAIGITNDNKINLKYDSTSGLDVVNDKLVIKLGEGLAFSNEGGVEGKLTLSPVTEQVVETVQKMENDLDSKLTTNFPMPQIDNVYDFADGSVSTIGNGDGLICQAFTVPINNPIRLATQENPNGTLFGVYAKQGFSPKIMLALYVYDWNHTDYVADTGPITIAAGRNEFPIKHINPNITELKSDCVYYAAIFIPQAARANNGLLLAGCPSYSQASYINATPRFTVRTENITGIDMNNPDAGLNILKPDSQTDYQWGPWSDGYNEQPGVPRFFIQIRNGSV